jgi:hypothetical protein
VRTPEPEVRLARSGRSRSACPVRLWVGPAAGAEFGDLLRGGVVYQALAHAHHVVDVIAKVPVEGDGALVGGPYLQVDLRASGSYEPPLRLAHEQPTESLPLIGGVNGQVVHPAAMSVVTGHHRPGQPLADLEHEESIMIVSELALDVAAGIVPWPQQTAPGPQGQQRVMIGWPVGAEHRRAG